MNTVQLKVERGTDGHFWGRTECNERFRAYGQGETLEALIQNIKDCIEDYQEHEGKEDEFWSKVDLKKLELIISN